MNTESAEQFSLTIYELCIVAELAHFNIEICSKSGERHIGVPTVRDDQLSPDWPSYGQPPMIDIDHTPIMLDQIASCTIYPPPGGVMVEGMQGNSWALGPLT